MNEETRGILISIIMPVYNCEASLPSSIQSVLGQDYETWELLLVDDCSTDNSKNIIKQYAECDQRIVPLYLEVNTGPAGARNHALSSAKGQYIAFLDSDDLWEPTKLSRQLEFMLSGNIAFSCTSYFSKNIDGTGAVYRYNPPKKITYRKALLLGNPIGNSTVMVRRDLINDLTIPNIKKRNDFALWLQVLKKGVVCSALNAELTIYQRREGSVSSQKIGLVPYQWELYRRIEALPWIISVFYMLSWAFVKTFHIGRLLERQ